MPGCGRNPAYNRVRLNRRERLPSGRHATPPSRERCLAAPVSSTQVFVIKPHMCADSAGQAACMGRFPPSRMPKVRLGLVGVLGQAFPEVTGTSHLWVGGTSCARSTSVPEASSGTWGTGTDMTGLLHVTAGVGECALGT